MTTAALCPRVGRTWLLRLDYANMRALWLSPACHNWSCPVCSKSNRATWARTVRDGVRHYIAQGEAWYFVTLTMSGKLKTFDRQVAVFHKCWAKFYARVKRQIKALRYVLIPERGELGRFHVHLITNMGLSKSDLKAIAVPSGLGWRVDTQPLKNPDRASFYCTKYLTKSIAETEWPKNLRRIRTSHKWPKKADLSDFEQEKGWTLVGGAEKAKKRALQLADALFVNVDVATGEILDSVPYTTIDSGKVKG